MNTIEEEPENFEQLENELFEEIIHSINEIDNQILSLLVQRETNFNLFKNMCYKYNKPNSTNDLIKSLNNRINNNYPNNNNLKYIFKYINSVYQVPIGRLAESCAGSNNQ